MLASLLSQDPSIFNLGQTRDLFRSYLKGELCSCGQRLNRCLIWSDVMKMTFSTESDSDISDFAVKLTELLRRIAEVRDWTQPDRMHELEARNADTLYTLRTFLSSVREITGASTLVDASKSPELAVAYSMTGEAQLKVLNLVRDPRAVASSWLKKKGLNAGKHAIAVWRDRQNRIEQWSSSCPERFRITRYEDFTKLPRSSLASILEWAELPHSNAFLSDFQARISWERLHLYPPANETFLSEKRPTLEISQATWWQNAGHGELHKLTSSVLLEKMERYGYLVRHGRASE